MELWNKRRTRRLFRTLTGYPATMSTSPVDPQEVRAAAEVHRDLGPEYSDAVIAEFIDRVDRAVAARVEARLAEERRHQPARRDRHRSLLKGVVLGVCAGALVAGVGISHVAGAGAHQVQAKVVPRGGFGPDKGFIVVPGSGQLKVIPRPAKPGAPQKPAAS
jgi:hypothetical protein